ncbi:MAG: PIN domain-containing protein [Gemmatimonadota bacterium]|nr:PIN domain-containing protein [Gemmatimonadota bacterium]
MIVAASSAILALMDVGNPHHILLRSAFRADREDWIIPSAALPELDYLSAKRLGPEAAAALHADLADGRYVVQWGEPGDLERALELGRAHSELSLGLVDGIVMAMAERLEARAIATLDLRGVAGVALKGGPEIWPRDLELGPLPTARTPQSLPPAGA